MEPSAPPMLDDEDQQPYYIPAPMQIQANIKPFTERQLLSLYQNPYIQQAHKYTEEFLASEKSLCFADCASLTESLNEYLRARMNLKGSEEALTRLRSELEELETKVWNLRDEKVVNEGVCHDKVKVSAMHHFQVAKFNSSAAASSAKTMRQIREELFEHHSLCSYKANKLKRKIDVHIQNLCQDDVSLEARKTAIGILFSFQRKLINDSVFIKDSRSWLDTLVRQLLQGNPSFQDRLLLLNHVLRCPAGVGHWAGSYIQIPSPEVNEDYLNNEALDQMIAALSIFFTPVKGRREMLREYCPPSSSEDNANADNPWVVLDSEGEDDENPANEAFPLRENDFVTILNQFPFEALFRYLLRIEKGVEVYDAKHFTTTSFFKLFAFGTQFINLLKSGLELFGHPSYRQLAKRLGHIIKHTLEYISDHWERFFQSHQGHPEEMAILNRIEVEYNNFFLRSTKVIFVSICIENIVKVSIFSRYFPPRQRLECGNI